MYVYLSLALQERGKGVSFSATLGYSRTNLSSFVLGKDVSAAILLSYQLLPDD